MKLADAWSAFKALPSLVTATVTDNGDRERAPAAVQIEFCDCDECQLERWRRANAAEARAAAREQQR